MSKNFIPAPHFRENGNPDISITYWMHFTREAGVPIKLGIQQAVFLLSRTG
ncbi:MAG: hypothetical protein HN356_08930 [Calditrichaeota bacterium]|nr:hypothetical protein [Calditrichota bacterium]MBT7617758.1 hypothetical protein [Calditrichota bacterium]MBT7789522.1 hypothetical protein [Calditrichota bacterium]